MAAAAADSGEDVSAAVGECVKATTIEIDAVAPTGVSPSSCPRLVGSAMPWLDMKGSVGGAAAAAEEAPTPSPPPAYSPPSPPRRLIHGTLLGSKRPRPTTASPACAPSAARVTSTTVALQAPSPPPPPPAQGPPTATALAYDHGHKRHAHPRRKHPERPERVDAVLAHLESRGVLGRCHLLELPGSTEAVAPDATLAGVHSPHYLARLRRLEAAPLDRLLTEAEGFDDVYLNEATVDCARRAAGALLALVTAVVQGEDGVQNGLALIRPPGHHAEAHHARGFCILNNVAVAVQHARRALGVGKVLVVDWDIHHGNGTQKAFLSDPDVLYISVHRYDHGRFFPGTGNPTVVGQGAGEGFTVNVAWNSGGMGDREYLAVWRRLVLPLAREFAPEVVLVSAGFDGAQGDEMGGCHVTPHGFGLLTLALVEGVPSAGGKVVLALEGGYKLSVLSQCVEACLAALFVGAGEGVGEGDGEGDGSGKKRPRAGDEKEEEEEEEEGMEEEEEDWPIAPEAEEAIERTLQLHRPFWHCLRRKE